MKIHRGPFIKTALLAAGAILVFVGVFTGIQALNGIIPGRMPNPEDISPIATAIGCVGDLIYLALIPVFGAAYVWFSRRDNLELTTTNAAFGGGLSSGPAFLLSMTISGITMSFNADYVATTMNEAGASITSNTIMLVYAVCGVGIILIFMLLSALGAFVYQSILQKQSSKEVVTPA